MWSVHVPARAVPYARYPVPVSPRRAQAAIDGLGLPRGGTVLDVGEAPPGLLLDAVARHEAAGVCLVATPDDALMGAAAAEREQLAGRVAFHAASPADFSPARRFDAILSVGAASRSFGPVEATAPRCLEWLRVGGVFLHGAPFLRRPLARAQRELLGESAAELPMRGATARAIVAAGFELTATAIVSESEWDMQASETYRAMLRRAAAHPDEAVGAQLNERAERAYQAYWRYGRETIGYALQAFRRPRNALRAL